MLEESKSVFYLQLVLFSIHVFSNRVHVAQVIGKMKIPLIVPKSIKKESMQVIGCGTHDFIDENGECVGSLQSTRLILRWRSSSSLIRGIAEAQLMSLRSLEFKNTNKIFDRVLSTVESNTSFELNEVVASSDDQLNKLPLAPKQIALVKQLEQPRSPKVVTQSNQSPSHTSTKNIGIARARNVLASLRRIKQKKPIMKERRTTKSNMDSNPPPVQKSLTPKASQTPQQGVSKILSRALTLKGKMVCVSTHTINLSHCCTRNKSCNLLKVWHKHLYKAKSLSLIHTLLSSSKNTMHPLM